jgi:hypothetical protein
MLVFSPAEERAVRTSQALGVDRRGATKSDTPALGVSPKTSGSLPAPAPTSTRPESIPARADSLGVRKIVVEPKDAVENGEP